MSIGKATFDRDFIVRYQNHQILVRTLHCLLLKHIFNMHLINRYYITDIDLIIGKTLKVQIILLSIIIDVGVNKHYTTCPRIIQNKIPLSNEIIA